mmetsp:Transcript_13740/g.33595  ORF Transcript_13740/g.33595 Transcript_13740/m.33595 type:complete len:114 (-) Transcript_13740:225-566(-)
MDFAGQKLADRLHQTITAMFGIIGFIYGYIQQRFAYTMYISMIGLAISAVLCVPDWGFLNQNPLQWHGSVEGDSKEEDNDDGQDRAPPQGSTSTKNRKNSHKNSKKQSKKKNK